MPGQRRFDFAVATEEDDGALRDLLRQIAMPGNITLAFLREPSFFLAEQVGSLASQVIVCKDHQQQRLMGMGSRSIRCVYIDGKPTRVGYLSMLRGIPEARGSIGLARGYKFLHTLHQDGAVPYYFTTILDDNTQAKALLTSGRAGLPTYQPIARLTTYLIPLTRKRSSKRLNSAVSKVDRASLSRAIAFQQEWSSRYQFAPVYTLQDIVGESTLLPHFSWQNLYLYREHDAIMGTLGVWDQQAFKQTVVTAYSNRMHWIRPWYNLFASVQGSPRLPPAGATINILYAGFVSGSKAIFAQLLHQACLDWSCKGYDYLSIGFSEDNELASVVSRYTTQRIASTLYLVYWHDTEMVLPKPSMPVHLEIATL